jgi:hypothetical protein
MRKTKDRELEDIFLDKIIWRVGSIKKGNVKPAYNYTDLKQNATDYKRSVDIFCDLILEHIEQAQHLVKQKDNYEQLLLDRMLADGYITEGVFDHYSPL